MPSHLCAPLAVLRWIYTDSSISQLFIHINKVFSGKSRLFSANVRLMGFFLN